MKQSTFYDFHPSNLVNHHNKTTNDFLSLGLTFCIQKDRLDRVVIADKPSPRFKRDKRLKYNFVGDQIIKQINKNMYTKSECVPPQACPCSEIMMDRFIQTIEKEQAIIYRHPPTTKLSTRQSQIMNHLRADGDIIILICDKNIWPAVMDTRAYIKTCPLPALGRRQSDSPPAVSFRSNYSDQTHPTLMTEIVSGKFNEEEANYFTSYLLKSTFRTPQFYGMPKVHKNTTPTPYVY